MALRDGPGVLPRAVVLAVLEPAALEVRPGLLLGAEGAVDGDDA
jgi:hypothetical protein